MAGVAYTNPFTQPQNQTPRYPGGPGVYVPPASITEGSEYDQTRGAWVDPQKGTLVQSPNWSGYTTDAAGNPVVTSDPNLYQTYASRNALSMAALNRAATTAPGPTTRGMSQSELEMIKNAIGFNNPSPVPNPNEGPSAANEEAARASAFARAKDTAGSIARSSMTALRNVLNARGMTGTDYETGKSADVLGGAANSLGQQNDNQLQGDLEYARHREQMEYAYEQAVASQKQQSMNSLLTLIMSRGGLY